MEASLSIAKALADGNRMRVISALMERDELCVCQLNEMLGLAGATVSRHMSILQNAGLVASRKEGRWVYYRLADRFPVQLRQWLEKSLLASPKIKLDRHRLQAILACGPDDLCRQQKERKRCC
jgi:ArsR family transcriptional regulator, arsenate/arsenite/antimonite-responsive transcriptional repressor